MLLSTLVLGGLAAAAAKVRCGLNPSAVNVGNLADIIDEMALDILAPLCGKNRGQFVTGDGRTYNCGKFPEEWGVKDANDITALFKAGNVSSETAVAIFDDYVSAVYSSSPPNEMLNDFTSCDANGYVSLRCSGMDDPPFSDDLDGDPIRSVTLAGLFTPAAWALDSDDPASQKQDDDDDDDDDSAPLDHHWRHFYVDSDFKEMKELGLNTVKIPVPASFFDKTPDEDHVLSLIVGRASEAGLAVILAIEGEGDYLEHVAEYVATAKELKGATVIAVEVTETSCKKTAITSCLPDLSKPTVWMLKLSGATTALNTFPTQDTPVYLNVPISHSATVADVASDNIVDDRQKLVYHESIACSGVSRASFAECRRGASFMVGSGFDLAIDKCAERSTLYKGQCERATEREDSDWWLRHTQSFAKRLFETYEARGLGWSFAAWKLSPKAEAHLPARVVAEISLKEAAKAGLLPAPKFGDIKKPYNEEAACSRQPLQDAALGDATMPPTPAYHWVPPPPTSAPTPCLANPDIQSNLGVSSEDEKGGLIFKVFVLLVLGILAVLLAWFLIKKAGRADGYQQQHNIETPTAASWE